MSKIPSECRGDDIKIPQRQVRKLKRYLNGMFKKWWRRSAVTIRLEIKGEEYLFRNDTKCWIWSLPGGRIIKLYGQLWHSSEKSNATPGVLSLDFASYGKLDEAEWKTMQSGNYMHESVPNFRESIKLPRKSVSRLRQHLRYALTPTGWSTASADFLLNGREREFSNRRFILKQYRELEGIVLMRPSERIAVFYG